jgi:SAM-dependent methyltransferase
MMACASPSCLARRPIVDGIPLLVGDFTAYAASERWMILRRRDLNPEIDAFLDSPLTEDSPERVRARMIDTYRHPAPNTAFDDFFRSALHRHASPSAFALDLGCAAGLHTPWLVPHAQSVAGIDLHFERVRAASEDHPAPSIRFLVADAEDPPFESHSAGIVLWLNLLDSIGRPRASLDGLLRILAPGALLLFSSPFAYTAAVSDPAEWVTEDEFDSWTAAYFDILESRDRLPWALPAGPRRTDLFDVRAAILRRKP